MLPYYHHHVKTYENTLITKFFGLHRIKPSSGQKVLMHPSCTISLALRLILTSNIYLALQFRFVVMGNMFFTDLRIHRRFDLKGSRLGRSADKVEIDENTILKDLDLNYSFFLEPSWREGLLKYCSLQDYMHLSIHVFKLLSLLV